MNQSNLYLIKGVKIDYDEEVLSYVSEAYESMMCQNDIESLTFIFDSMKREYMYIGKVLSFESSIDRHSSFGHVVDTDIDLNIHDIEVIVDIVGEDRSAPYEAYLIADCH